MSDEDYFEEVEDSIFVSGDDTVDPDDEQPMVCSCRPPSQSQMNSESPAAYSMCTSSKCCNFQRQIECVSCHPCCGNNR
jgi:hypothetical protein